EGGPRLKAFSMVFPAAPVDDRPFTEAVREAHGADVHYVPPPPPGPVRCLDAALHRAQGPFVDAHHGVVDALLAASAGEGCHTLLTGLRGDDVFGGLSYLADRVRRLRLRGLRAELEAWSAVLGQPSHRLLWSLGVRPLLRRPD